MRAAIAAEAARDKSRGNPNRLFHDALAKAAHDPALVQVYDSGAISSSVSLFTGSCSTTRK